MKVVIQLLAVAGFLVLAACETKGPAERAGEKIDDAMESAADGAREVEKDIEEAMED